MLTDEVSQIQEVGGDLNPGHLSARVCVFMAVLLVVWSLRFEVHAFGTYTQLHTNKTGMEIHITGSATYLFSFCIILPPTGPVLLEDAPGTDGGPKEPEPPP